MYLQGVIHMNLKSQQLRSDLSLEIDFDQTLTSNEIKEKLTFVLGKENCSEETLLNRKVFVYTNKNGIKEVLLFASISYLGGDGVHPIFKKRIQLKTSFKDIALALANRTDYFVRFLGVYHYKGNIVFVDFVKDTYLTKKMHNSAAHVYVNDLYQGMKNGIFKKVDKNDNTLYVVKYTRLKDYLNDNVIIENRFTKILQLFEKFNFGFPFGQWLEAIKCVEEMRNKNWSQWAQSEWAGWFLEYRFYNFTKENNTDGYCKYIRQKGQSELDFDLWFNEVQFFGDLKSESLSSAAILGNDKESVLEAINAYDRLWYIVYEHDTIKDKDKNYEASEFINQVKFDNGKWPKGKIYDSHSYGDKLKYSVNYKKMYIIEVNRINYGEVLSDFNQGKQPNGDPRKQKVAISKKILDNFVIYRHDFKETV